MIAGFNPHPARGPSATCRRSFLDRLVHLVFQSSPGPWAECNVSRLASLTALSISTFQSSPGPWAECNARQQQHSDAPAGFNPHPARGPSATVEPEEPCSDSVEVSILTRPVGRVQPPRRLPTPTLASWFQSSPGPWAECNSACISWPERQGGVSILTRPVGRVQQAEVEERHEWRRVSILTRPVGRVQHRQADLKEIRVSILRPRGPSAILTRPKVSPTVFQSSPGPWAECNVDNHPAVAPAPVFQSSPGPWAECNPMSPGLSIVARGPRQHNPDSTGGGAKFQSSPGPWAECNLPGAPTTSSGPRFQSSPGPWAECNHVWMGNMIIVDPVSILTRPVGRVQLLDVDAQLVVSRCFNPHPARGPSATRGPDHLVSAPGPRVFQSSPGPWAECNWRGSWCGRPSTGCFNPHPARGPMPLRDAALVSILTRPVGRVQRPEPSWRSSHCPFSSVSILTRPVGRVQLLYSFFLLVHREPPQPWQSVSTYCSSQLGDPSTVQVGTRTLNWGVRSQWVRVTPGEDR